MQQTGYLEKLFLDIGDIRKTVESLVGHKNMKQYMQVIIIIVLLASFIVALCACNKYVTNAQNSLVTDHEKTNGKMNNELTNLAFILLSEDKLPDAKSIKRALQEFSANDYNLQIEQDNNGNSEQDKVIFLKFNTGEKIFVALMPVPVPKGEADQCAQFSLSTLRNNWKLPPHHAHLLVTFHAAASTPPIVNLSRFTSLVAAVTKVSPAVGVYWGNAGATHDSEFFKLVASEKDIMPRMMLWSGVSIAREKDGRLSILSLGMKQLNLPDLLLISGKSSESVALATMFDLLAYIAESGKAIQEGETVGRTAEEKLPVRYVPSPIDSSLKVWCVELP